MIAPVFRDYRAWRAKWTKLVWKKATRLELAARSTTRAYSRSWRMSRATRSRCKENYFKPLQAFVYKDPVGSSAGGGAPASSSNGQRHHADDARPRRRPGRADRRATCSARTGKDVVVLEAEDQVGGLAKTVERDGYRFDLGGHRFFTKAKEVDELWHEVLGDEFLQRPRMSRIYWNNRYLDYPLRGPGRDQEARPDRADALHGVVPRRRREAAKGRRTRSRSG